MNSVRDPVRSPVTETGEVRYDHGRNAAARRIVDAAAEVLPHVHVNQHHFAGGGSSCGPCAADSAVISCGQTTILGMSPLTASMSAKASMKAG